MKKIIFIFTLSFLGSGCYIPFPNIGIGGKNYMHERNAQEEEYNYRAPRQRRRQYYHNNYRKSHIPQRQQSSKLVCEKQMTSFGVVVQSCRERFHTP